MRTRPEPALCGLVVSAGSRPAWSGHWPQLTRIATLVEPTAEIREVTVDHGRQPHIDRSTLSGNIAAGNGSATPAVECRLSFAAKRRRPPPAAMASTCDGVRTRSPPGCRKPRIIADRARGDGALRLPTRTPSRGTARSSTLTAPRALWPGRARGPARGCGVARGRYPRLRLSRHLQASDCYPARLSVFSLQTGPDSA